MYTHIGLGHLGIEFYLLLSGLSNENTTSYILVIFPLLLAMIHSMEYNKKKKSPIDLEPAIQLRKYTCISEAFSAVLNIMLNSVLQKNSHL